MTVWQWKKWRKKNLGEQTAWRIYSAPYIMKVIRRKFGIKRNQLLVMKAWTRVVYLDWMEYLENILLLEPDWVMTPLCQTRKKLHYSCGSEQNLLDTIFQTKNDFLMDFPQVFSRSRIQIFNEQTDFHKFWVTE